ncbi:branched-chain amino acid ABC transporter permease [Specibacter sp. RAF43]|uniref:branched-chain amino acid ABC transporter permease n=1 Tax=Specibacter sp. RAF43 TaxID=3233057 RepID=UPI003F969061
MQGILTGLTLGVVYGIVGAGYVIIHRMTGMVNFAQGDIAMAGAFGAVVASAWMPSFFAAIVGGLLGAALALVLYRFAIRPLRSKGTLVQTIATLGAAIVIRSVVQLIFGSQPYSMPAFISGDPINIAGGTIAIQGLVLIAIAVALYFALSFFFDKTLIGKALSACAINPYAARVVGINVAFMATAAFLVSGAISGFIGAGATPLAFATVSSGLALSLKGFIAAILGGFDKIGLTIVGGFLVGLAESLIAIYISTSYQELIIMAALICLLVLRPAGLTRLRVSQRV